jgi:hypothetical protein
MHGMTDLYDALAGEIMRMMEDDRGLVRKKYWECRAERLRELIIDRDIICGND